MSRSVNQPRYTSLPQFKPSLPKDTSPGTKGAVGRLRARELVDVERKARFVSTVSVILTKRHRGVEGANESGR